MARWCRQWLQFQSFYRPLRRRELPTIHHSQGVVTVVCPDKPPQFSPSLTHYRSITNFNVVIAVLSMFIMLVKAIMYMLHVFPPVLSAIVHGIILALYSVSIAYQASSDTSDPLHPQNGPPWYVTKPCSVTRNKSLVGYCRQAKASFACTCAALGIFGLYFILSVWSCFPSKAQREEYEERKRLQAEKYAGLETIPDSKTGRASVRYPVPDTPGFQGGLNPMTPRTLAFNTLGGTKDLPLRSHFSTPNVQPTSPTYNIRSPDIQRSPMSPGFVNRAGMEDDEAIGKAIELSPSSPKPANLYFPPPPKTSKK